MNTTIELHDSRLAEIQKQGDTIILSFVPVYLHKSSGRPGIDTGSGWIQDAKLVFSNSILDGHAFDLPCDILDGKIIIRGKTHDNSIPVPLEISGEVELHLVFSPAHKLTVKGKSVRLELLSEPKYVEEFKP